MAISKEDTTAIFAFAGVGVLLYLLTRQMGQGDQPRFGPNQKTYGEVNYDDYMGGIGSEYFMHPARHVEGVVTLPIRFPHRSGHEITCLIHDGWSAMTKSAPQDADWMSMPPSEADL